MPDPPPEIDAGRHCLVEGAVNPVQQTHQLYIPTETARHDEWPFEADDTYRGIVHESGCVVLWPQGAAPELPLLVEPPSADRIPWPISSMGAPPPTWARLDEETAATVAAHRSDTPASGQQSDAEPSTSTRHSERADAVPDRPDAHPGRNTDTE